MKASGKTVRVGETRLSVEKRGRQSCTIPACPGRYVGVLGRAVTEMLMTKRSNRCGRGREGHSQGTVDVQGEGHDGGGTPTRRARTGVAV